MCDLDLLFYLFLQLDLHPFSLLSLLSIRFSFFACLRSSYLMQVNVLFENE